jgi:site-specific DNA recombinase
MAATLAGLRVGAYVRVSEDREDDAKAVGRQEEDTRALVARHGGTVAKLYAENDTSAYRKRRVQRTDDHGETFHVYRVIRPVFQEMLSDLRRGDIDAAVVYDLDRLARDPRDLEDVIEIVEHYRRPILDVSGSVDLMTDNGRSMARVGVTMANRASADTARRVKRKHQENAENGVPVGGERPFGWDATPEARAILDDARERGDEVAVRAAKQRVASEAKRLLSEVEAPLVREAAERVLAGAPLSAVVTEWNACGLRTTRGNAWTPKSLGLVLTNPRVCGYSARNVEGPDGRPVLTVVKRDGQPVVGEWSPILSVETWEALVQALAPKARRPGGNVHKYLLSGLAACGKCGEPMRGLPRGRVVDGDGAKSWRTFAYQCHSKSLGGCGGVSILGPAVDELVTDAVFRRYERSRPKAGPLPTWNDEEALERADRQVQELHAAYRAGDLEAADYFAMRREVADEAKRLRAERAAVLADHAAMAAAPDDLRAEWDGYSLAQKRVALGGLLVAVEVLPAVDDEGRARRLAVEDRVRPVWRSPDA